MYDSILDSPTDITRCNTCNQISAIDSTYEKLFFKLRRLITTRKTSKVLFEVRNTYNQILAIGSRYKKSFEIHRLIMTTKTSKVLFEVWYSL